jgi:AraC-like DNA-binding protein
MRREAGAMKNILMDAEARNVLLDPGAWRLVGTGLEHKVRAVNNRRHLTWMKSNTDRHPHREIMVALKGRGVYGFRGKAYPCVPGTVILFDSNEPHDLYYSPQGVRMQHLWLRLIEPGIIAGVVNVSNGRCRYGKSVALGVAGASTMLGAAWNELVSTPRLPRPLRRAKIVAALEAVFAAVIEAGYGVKPEPAEPGFAASVIDMVRQHVDAHAGRGIPLGEAARLSGYSKFHFLRLFKQRTGQTYHAYVNACRRQKAATMLGEGRRKKEISEALGFSHASAFLRWMKGTGAA